MQLLLYPVSLILFVVFSIATPPPGYVKPTNYDKDPPRYDYRYEIANDDGKESQGKSETRSGEMASGRYYVNGEKSTTDVKYYADEWGYHPLVKYRASNDHSVATTHFALGEHVVKSLLNGSEVGEEVKLLPLKIHQNQPHRHQFRRRRPIQIVQPYTPELTEAASSTTSRDAIFSNMPDIQSIDDVSDVNSPSNYDSKRISTADSKLEHGISSTLSFEQNFNNFVTLPRPSSESVEESRRLTADVNDYVRQRTHPGSIIRTTGIPDHRTFTPSNINRDQSSTTSPWSSEKVDSQNENLLRANEDGNDLLSTISDDVLHVENAGSFGRRIKPTLTPLSGENLSRSKSHRKIISSSSGPSYEASTSRSTQQFSETNVKHGASSYMAFSTSVTPHTNGDTYSTLISNDAEHFISTPKPDLRDLYNSVGTEATSSDYEKTITDIRHGDNAVSSTYSGVFSKIHPNGNGDQEKGQRVNSLIINNSKLIRYEGEENNASSIQETGRSTTSGLSNYGNRVDYQLYVTLRQSLDSEIRDFSNVPSATPPTLPTYSSKPIVVAELPSYKADKGIEYSTTFPCHHEESTTIIPSVSSTFSSTFAEDSVALFVTPEHQAHQSHITTSSVILNPIQAGVSLVNADQTELIRGENQEGVSPAPVSENIDGDSPTGAMKNFPSGHGNELGKIVTEETRSKFYETINPAYVQSTFRKSMGTSKTGRNSASNAALVDGNTEDQQIEIQKSVEIYHNAPVHEIHYPPQVITQVSGINHLREQEVKQHRESIAELLHQRDEVKEAGETSSSYVELQDVGNAKQFHSPVQVYNSEEKVSHESRGTQLSSENIRDSSLIGASVYHGNHVRQDNELVDYPMEQNNGLPTLLPGREDGPRIIKLIRDSIPEVKYTAAKTPRINVKVYPTLAQTNENEQTHDWHQEVLPLQEQRDYPKVNTAEQTKRTQSQLQKILSESESVQQYVSGNEWNNFQSQEQQRQQQQQQQQHDRQITQQHQHQRNQQTEEYRDFHGNYQVQENIDEPKQPVEQQSTVQPWVQFHDTSGLNNVHGNTGNPLVDGSTTAHSVQQLHSSGLTQERIIEKTIHVPQPYPVEVPRIIEKKIPYPVEKIVEKKIPYPVEKIIEKKIPVPHPYPVHIQVPVDRVVEKQVQILQPYPVHIEKIIEKKVPYPVQKLVPQPYPVHILQPYPVEKIIEKPVHIPVTVEKIVEKKVHIPQPYPVQVPIKVPYPVEITKYVENTVQVPYGVRYGVSYQQIMKPQSYKGGLYGSQSTVSVPLYGVSLVSNHNRDRERPNVTQEFQGYNYNKPAIPFISGIVDSTNIDQQRSNGNGWEKYAYDKLSAGQDNSQHYQTFAKKSYLGYTSKIPSLTYPLRNYSGTNRRQISYRHNNAPAAEQSISKDEYVGPVPLLKYNSHHQIVRSRSSTDQQQHQPSFKPQHSTAVTRASSSATLSDSPRRTRQQDNSSHLQTGPGAFRQSKIEYGFKPPMVPSVQYDEKTATKVEK